MADSHADPELHARFDAKYLGAQRRTVTEILDRAVARGELTTRPGPAILNALLVGPVFAWLFLLSESPDRGPALNSAVRDAVLALTTPGPPPAQDDATPPQHG
ncbi:TetR/AcrR family transcriptional regulator C-terminal ligand-binding domain-containing protein (plasmid) [Streptomycetaceae bacterium NBC_01309]